MFSTEDKRTERRDRIIYLVFSIVALWLVVFVANAQEATSTEGVDVQPDGTPIINVVDLPPSQRPFVGVARVAAVEDYLATLTVDQKLDLILNKVVNVCGRR